MTPPPRRTLAAFAVTWGALAIAAYWWLGRGDIDAGTEEA